MWRHVIEMLGDRLDCLSNITINISIAFQMSRFQMLENVKSISGFSRASSVSRAGSGCSSETFYRSSQANGPKDSAPTGHTRWKEDEDEANKHCYRKKIGGDIGSGNSCMWCSCVVKGSRAFDCRTFLMVDRSLDPALPVKECWGNTWCTHWQQATLLYHETTPIFFLIGTD